MKKNWIFYLLLILLLVLNIDYVSAAQVKDDATDQRVKPEATYIECIYGNGISVKMTYNSATKSFSASIDNYSVIKSVNIEFGGTLGSTLLWSSDTVINKLKTFQCPNTIQHWLAYSEDEDGNRAYSGIYNYGMTVNGQYVTHLILSGEKNFWGVGAEKEDTDNENGVIPVWFVENLNSVNAKESNCDKKYRLKKFKGIEHKVNGSWEYCSPEASIPLVGERLYITDEIEDGAYYLTFKTHIAGGSEDDQAIKKPKYAQFLIANNNRYLLSIGKTTTSVADSQMSQLNSKAKNNQDLYVCIKQSSASSDPDRGDKGVIFNSTRHEILKVSNSSNITCPTGSELYVKTSEVCKITATEQKESFCDKYSNTAFVLIDIIQILRILVPAFVIVLTGIEIGRIVVAGNVEEELPKRKQSIIIRFIIMVAFFFLPTITQLIISLAEGVDILDVSCLFEDPNAPATEKGEELNCVDVK